MKKQCSCEHHHFSSSDMSLRARLVSSGLSPEDIQEKLEAFRQATRALRELLRISIAQLAAAVDVSPATISAYEQGADIKECTFDKICGRLGLHLGIDQPVCLTWGQTAEDHPWNLESVFAPDGLFN